MTDQDETEWLKGWLRERRLALDLTQEELAAAIGVDTRTILNAEKSGASLPRGLPFYRLLRELGAVTVAPADQVPTVTARLADLEARVAKVATKADLQRGLATTQEAIAALASPGRRRGTGS